MANLNLLWSTNFHRTNYIFISLPKKKKKTHNPTQDGSMTKSFKTKHLIDLWMIPS